MLNTQYYKVRIKGKVEQSRERKTTLPLNLGVAVIEKETFVSPSTSVANFPYLLYKIYQLNFRKYLPNPSTRVRCDTMSFFELNLTSFN